MQGPLELIALLSPYSRIYLSDLLEFIELGDFILILINTEIWSNKSNRISNNLKCEQKKRFHLIWNKNLCFELVLKDDWVFCSPPIALRCEFEQPCCCTKWVPPAKYPSNHLTQLPNYPFNMHIWSFFLFPYPSQSIDKNLLDSLTLQEMHKRSSNPRLHQRTKYGQQRATWISAPNHESFLKTFFNEQSWESCWNQDHLLCKQFWKKLCKFCAICLQIVLRKIVQNWFLSKNSRQTWSMLQLLSLSAKVSRESFASIRSMSCSWRSSSSSSLSPSSLFQSPKHKDHHHHHRHYFN